MSSIIRTIRFFTTMLLAACMVLLPHIARAEGNETEAYLKLDLGAGFFAPPKLTFVYSTTESLNIYTDDGYTENFGIRFGHALKGLGWAEDSFFGAAPVVELVFRHDGYEERAETSRTFAAGPTAGYGVTGAWSGGTWDYTQDIDDNGLWLGLWGSRPDDEGFVPYVGIGYHQYSQGLQFNANAGGSYNRLIDSDLDANSFDLRFGGKFNTVLFSRWQVGVRPMVYLSHIRASLDYTQHQVLAYLSGAVDSASKSFSTCGASLDLSVRTNVMGRLSMGLTTGAVYNDGTPYTRLPTISQGRATIRTASSHAYRCMIDFTLEY